MSQIIFFGYFVNMAEVTKPKDPTKKMKDTSFVKKKEENRVVEEEDPQMRVGNPFAVVHEGEENSTTFWQPIWSCKIFTLF